MNTGDGRSTYVAHDRRIAIIGGLRFDNTALDKFLWNLKAKYPNAVIVTGEGRGAEKHAADSARLLGLRVEQHTVTEQETAWFGDEALMCQVNTILAGDIDVVVVVGNGGRVKRAWEIHHRLNMTPRNVRGGLVKNKDGTYASGRTIPRVIHELPAPAKVQLLAA